MVEQLTKIIATFNSLTPLGLAGALAYIIYLLVKNKKEVKAVGENHLSGLPEMQQDIREIVQLLRPMVNQLQGISASLNYLKGRINGGGDRD